MATDGEIGAWVQSIGWPDTVLGTCVGRAFADEHGGRLPLRDELCSWANVTGRRKPDGTWVCPSGGLELPDVQTWWLDLSAKARAWVFANPVVALGSLAAVVLLVSQQAAKGLRK